MSWSVYPYPMRPKARGLAQHGGPPGCLHGEEWPSRCDFVRYGRSMPPADGPQQRDGLIWPHHLPPPLCSWSIAKCHSWESASRSMPPASAFRHPGINVYLTYCTLVQRQRDWHKEVGKPLSVSQLRGEGKDPNKTTANISGPRSSVHLFTLRPLSFGLCHWVWDAELVQIPYG